MKKFIGALLLACGLVSCSACTGPKAEPVMPDGTVDAGLEAGVMDAVDAEVQAVTVTGDSWSLTFPNGNWKLDDRFFPEKTDASDPLNASAYFNREDQNLVLVVTQPFSGTMQEFALLAIRGATNSGQKVLSSESVVVNGNVFVFVKTDELWAWLGVKNGTGYSLVCGGLVPDDVKHLLLCNQISSTFKVE